MLELRNYVEVRIPETGRWYNIVNTDLVFIEVQDKVYCSSRRAINVGI